MEIFIFLALMIACALAALAEGIEAIRKALSPRQATEDTDS